MRTNTMRSPFFPEIFAQSSGLVVFGRSSCSRNSWRIESSRSCGGDALLAAIDLTLDRQLLRPPHDVLDHGARGEVLEEEDLLVAVLVGDLEEAVGVVDGVHAVDRVVDHAASTAFPGRRGCWSRSSAIGRSAVRYWREDLASPLLVGPLDLDLHVEAAGAQDRGVDEVLAVRRADHDHVLQALDAVDLGEQLRHDRALDVGARSGAAVRNNESISSKNTMTGTPSSRLLARTLEDQADLALGLAHVLVEELGALDVEEVRPRRCRPSSRATRCASELATALAISVFRSRAARRAGCPSAVAARARGTSPRSRYGSSTCRISSIWSSRPPTSA